jgi:hypothetical protein
MRYVKFLLILSALYFFSGSPIPKISAQSNMSGTWKVGEVEFNRPDKDDAEAVEKNEKGDFQISFSRQTKGNYFLQSSNFNFSDFRGLTKEQTVGSNVSVNFSLAREAGTIQCVGTFNNGKGSGTFSFSADRNFADAMQNRGFTFTDENLFSAAFLGLTVAFVDDIKSAGFKKLETEDLFKGKIFNVDSSFIKEMATSGFANLEMEELVKAKIFKINGKFIREAAEMGFKENALEDLVKLRIFKITPKYLGEMKSVGLGNLSAEEATKLRIFKVTPAFVGEINSEGLTDLSVEEVVKLKTFNIDGEYIRLVKSKGYKDLDVEKLVDMKIFRKVKQ